MNKPEENRYSMLVGVQSLLGEKREIVDTIPKFSETVDEFDVTVQSIGDLNNQYQNVSGGATGNKAAAKDALIDTIMEVSGPLSVYAKHTKDENLRSLMDQPESLYRYNLRDTELFNRVKLIGKRVTENQENLAPYGITAEKVASLTAAITAYNTALSSKETRVASAIGAREGLTKVMNEADEILKEEIDPFMESFRKSHQSFYNEYMAARVIKDV